MSSAERIGITIVMQQAIILMVEGRMGGIESGHRDLRPELAKLIVSDDVKAMLANARYVEFLELFEGFAVNVAHQMASSQVEGCVTVGVFSFYITTELIVEISGLLDDGLKIQRDKHPQITELDFLAKGEKIGWDDKYILCEGLP